MFNYREEFPDFPEAEMPEVPRGFEDASWRNDSAPTFQNTELLLMLWVDYADPAKREFPECERFGLKRLGEDGAPIEDERPEHCLIASNDWNDILAAIVGEQFAADCRELFTDAQFAEIRHRNAQPEYSGDICATHDFADANEIMAPAFAKVVGHEPRLDEHEHGDEAVDADCALWGAAWTHAKTQHLTAAEDEASPIDKLAREYGGYCADQGLPAISADEHGAELTHDQRMWIDDFIERWDAAERAAQKQ